MLLTEKKDYPWGAVEGLNEELDTEGTINGSCWFNLLLKARVNSKTSREAAPLRVNLSRGLSLLTKEKPNIGLKNKGIYNPIRVATAGIFEPKQRALLPQFAAGVASETKISKIPYGGRFFAADSGELQSLTVIPDHLR